MRRFRDPRVWHYDGISTEEAFIGRTFLRNDVEFSLLVSDSIHPSRYEIYQKSEKTEQEKDPPAIGAGSLDLVGGGSFKS